MVDITVRGAGIFGLSIAWACAQRGATVQVVDPNGAGSGASGGLVGALAPHVPEKWNVKKAFQLDSLLMAQTFWQEVSEAGGVDPSYARTGRLQSIADDHHLALAHQRAKTAVPLWQGHAIWEVVKSTSTEWAPVSPTGWMIRDTLSAHIHPVQACAALCAALVSRGIKVVAKAPDQGQVIWASGVAGLQDLSHERKRPVGNGVKGQAAVLSYDAAHLPQIYTNSLHVIPHLNGTVAVGSTSETQFDAPDTTDDQIDTIIAAALQAVPALKDAPVLAKWAGVRPRSRSRSPMLGPWPDRPGHFIANGGFKIGFGIAPKVAEVIADLTLDGKNRIPAEFDVKASF